MHAQRDDDDDDVESKNDARVREQRTFPAAQSHKSSLANENAHVCAPHSGKCAHVNISFREVLFML